MIEQCLGYVDPGAGSIVLQVLIGSAMGMMLYFRERLGRLLRLRPRRRSQES